MDLNSWTGSLYKSTNNNKISVKVKAVPYYAWCNRNPREI
ncbi:hypothetical protein [Oceanobacillus sp. Castelsardo]